MNTRSIADTKAHLSSCVASAEAGEPVLITRHGRLVAAMIGAEEWERLQALVVTRRRGLAGLIGGWEDSDALARRVNAVTASRSRPRPLPELE